MRRTKAAVLGAGIIASALLLAGCNDDGDTAAETTTTAPSSTTTAPSSTTAAPDRKSVV